MEEEKKTKKQKIAQTCILIYGLDSGGYNSKLFGILLWKLKPAPVDVISNKGHVDLMYLVCTKEYPWQRVPGLSLLVTSYGVCSTSVCRLLRSLLQTVCRRRAADRAEEDQHPRSSLYTVLPRQGRETRHSISYTKYRGPTFDLSSFKIDYLVVWLILHIIQNKRSPEHWPF